VTGRLGKSGLVPKTLKDVPEIRAPLGDLLKQEVFGLA
jgi:hypothetical protein